MYCVDRRQNKSTLPLQKKKKKKKSLHASVLMWSFVEEKQTSGNENSKSRKKRILNYSNS